jgi:hypothetical protein
VPLLKPPSSAAAMRIQVTVSRLAAANLYTHDFYGVTGIGCDPNELVTPSFKARNELLDLFDIGLRNGCGIPAIHSNASRAAGEQQRDKNEESHHGPNENKISYGHWDSGKTAEKVN